MYTYSVFESTNLGVTPSLHLTSCMSLICLFFISLIFVYWTIYLFNFNKYLFFFRMYFFFFEFFHTIVNSYLSKKNSIIFFPFLFYLFLFVFFFNICGLLPGIFTTTSHFSFTVILAINIWLVVITLGFSIKTIKFFNIIIPKNVPSLLLPFLIFIEFLSYFFRFISLSLRLFANILAGHILIHVLTVSVLKTLTGEFVDLLLGGLTYFAFIILFCFEMIVGFLQGYILFILSVIYLTDLENNAH